MNFISIFRSNANKITLNQLIIKINFIMLKNLVFVSIHFWKFEYIEYL